MTAWGKTHLVTETRETVEPDGRQLTETRIIEVKALRRRRTGRRPKPEMPLIRIPLVMGQQYRVASDVANRQPYGQIVAETLCVERGVVSPLVQRLRQAAAGYRQSGSLAWATEADKLADVLLGAMAGVC